MGFGRRSARKVESYLHSQRAPVVASDQNVVTSDPTGRESRRRSEAEQPRRSRRSDAAISTLPAKQRSRTATTKREDGRQTLDA
ncbi:hypothetical protein M5K25_015086 [Dendrobium thyrsiflorum]|uniref:Uncharacterized protein n=1 Tax=Dendrobium thyrsiflorum TaxID=117978 RepID=A0ABD0UPZ8_DENTH